ncbi:MAG: outer membrane protein [Candidatus Eiseniibacteriota bacterium]
MKALHVGWVGLCGLLLALPAPASAEAQNTVLLRSASYDSYAKRPIRRYAPSYHRQAPYGFFNIGGGLFDPVHQPGDGFYGVVSGGSEVGKALDVGVQLSWYHRGTHGEEFGSSYVGPGGNIIQTSLQTQSVDTDLLPLMGIVRLRIPIGPGFQPYVGGGAGYEWLFIQGIDNNGYAFSNDYGGFGAQAMAGVTMMASSTVGLYGEAVYNWTDVEADFYDPFYGAIVHETLNYDAWAYHGGFRFRF